MDHVLIEAKFDAGDDGLIEGKAWDFTAPDRVGDMIEPAAFRKAAFPLPMLFGHDQNDPVGVWEAASEGKGGLMVKGRLLIEDLPRAREVRALVRAGAVKGLSIGFTTRKAMSRQGGGRTIKDLELHEISLVTLPMHPGARVTSAKSAVEALRLVSALNRASAQLARKS